MFDDGRITPFLVKKIIKKLKEKKLDNDPLKILYLFKDLISPKLIKSAYDEDLDTAFKKKEIILFLIVTLLCFSMLEITARIVTPQREITK